MNWKLIACVALLSYGAYHHFSQRAVKHGAGEIAPNSPIQTDSHAAPIQVNDFTLIPLADYNILAHVLSRDDYTFDAGASLSPTDLALGWEPMSDETVLNKMDISQGNRFFSWRVDMLPIPQHEIEIHAANMPIIPANDAVKSQLKQVRKGQVVSVKGQLCRSKKSRWLALAYLAKP